MARTCALAGFRAAAEVDRDLVEWDDSQSERRRTAESRTERPAWELCRDGCHIAAMGGSCMRLVYGCGGLRDACGTSPFWPRRAPEDQALLQFPLIYHGQQLEVEVGRETVTDTLREGAGLVLHHATAAIELTPAQPRAVRPVSRR